MFDSNFTELNSYDELPLWSAPFGLMLLDTIQLKQGMKVLDVGSGNGFPMLEIADRLGSPGHVTGIDPLEDAIRIINKKISRREVPNASLIQGFAEEMPFENEQFDLITSNNGLNNVNDQSNAFRECFRVAKHGAQMVITMNLPHTMIEFYEIVEEVLRESGRMHEVILMEEHIASKRKTVEFLKEMIISTGFSIKSINPDGFNYRFTSAEALLHHYLIRNYFLDSWKEFLPLKKEEEVMQQVRQRINTICEQEGEFNLSIPFACFNCFKPFNI